MTKAVFTTKVEPTYDDLPEIKYHFPKSYLGAAERAVGDWIVYYEPRRTSGDPSSHGGRQAYFATARVTAIEPDPNREDHFYAFVTDYLDLDRPVPFREGSHYYEAALQRDDGGTSKGAFGRALRLLPEDEYDLILRAGFAPLLAQPARWTEGYDIPGAAEEPATFERPIIESIVARPFRDAAFARQVKAAYDNTCAVTRIKLINGGGRAEVQAAHIRPVQKKGPDSVRNGVALSGTIHWMFDRGLISIDDDYKILVARDRVPDTVARLIDVERGLYLPRSNELWPHLQFIRYHRREVFKG